jgi:hypothetical protein
VEAQYGTDADEARFAGKVVAVNVDRTCDAHYEDGDKEAGKPWSRVRRAAAVDAESGMGGELGGEVEEGILGGRSTFEVEAIAALAWCGEGNGGVHAAAIEDGEEEDGDEVAFAFGGKGGGSLSSSSTDTKKKKRKRQKQVPSSFSSTAVAAITAATALLVRSAVPGRKDSEMGECSEDSEDSGESSEE